MIIENATVTSITKKTGSGPTGQATYAAPVAVNLRCFVDSPSRQQRLELGATITSATGVMYLDKKAAIAALGAAPANGDKLTYLVDDSASVTQQVLHVIDRQKAGGLAHFETYLKAL